LITVQCTEGLSWVNIRIIIIMAFEGLGIFFPTSKCCKPVFLSFSTSSISRSSRRFPRSIYGLDRVQSKVGLFLNTFYARKQKQKGHDLYQTLNRNLVTRTRDSGIFHRVSDNFRCNVRNYVGQMASCDNDDHGKLLSRERVFQKSH